MSKITKGNQPCPSDKCSSSDAYFVYDDGHGYCYSCKSFFKGSNSSSPKIDGSYQYVPHRGIDLPVFRKYGVLVRCDDHGKPNQVVFPYGHGNFKTRDYDTKGGFHSIGDMKGGKVFGADIFTRGQHKAITITEGEYDAMAAYQMLGCTYPVVSVRSSTSASKDIEAYYDFINSFDRIYLCLDADKPGEEATKEIARLFDFNKVYHVQLGKYKDANEYLQNGDGREFLFSWHNAKRFMPKGIVSEYSEVKKILEDEGREATFQFPFGELQEMTYGIRRGECTLLTALEGIGKTEIVRAIEYHALKETDENVGIIHLEEDEKRSIQGLAGYELALPAHLPDSELAVEDILGAYQALTKRDSRVHFYSHFGSDNPDVILDTIRFMVTVCGCTLVVLDHITMVVTGYETEDERRKLDYISTRLAMMTKELDFALVLVSHVNDDGKTRGSRNISKVADTHIHLDRDLEAPSLRERNTTKLSVRKNRYSGHTGPAGFLVFDPKTFRIEEMTVDTEIERKATDEIPDF